MEQITLAIMVNLAKELMPQLTPVNGYKTLAVVHYYKWMVEDLLASHQTVEVYADGSLGNPNFDRPFPIPFTDNQSNPTIYEFDNGNGVAFTFHKEGALIFNGIRVNFISQPALGNKCIPTKDRFYCPMGDSKFAMVDPTNPTVLTNGRPVLDEDVVTANNAVGVDYETNSIITFNESQNKLQWRSLDFLKNAAANPIRDNPPTLLKWGKPKENEDLETGLLDPKYMSIVLGINQSRSYVGEYPLNTFGAVRFVARKISKVSADDAAAVETMCTHIREPIQGGVSALIAFNITFYACLYMPLNAAIIIWILLDRRRKNVAPQQKAQTANAVTPITPNPEDEDVFGENNAFVATSAAGTPQAAAAAPAT